MSVEEQFEKWWRTNMSVFHQDERLKLVAKQAYFAGNDAGYYSGYSEGHLEGSSDAADYYTESEENYKEI